MRLNSTLFYGSILVNPAISGSIGTALATVDQAALIEVNATAANLNLTMPAPTLGNGSSIAIRNSGVNFFYIEGVAIRPQGLHVFHYFAGAWRSQSSMPTLQFTPIQFAAALTFVPAHHGHILEYTGVANINVTVPNNLPIGWQVSLSQVGTGTFTIVGSGGMVPSNRWGGDTSQGRWAKVGLEVRTATSAIISGDVI